MEKVKTVNLLKQTSNFTAKQIQKLSKWAGMNS